MDHLIIFINIFSIVIGVWAIFICDQIRKNFNYDFLKYYEVYIILFNIILFVYLIAKYFYTNLFDSNLSNIPPLFAILVIISAFFLELGLVYNFTFVILKVQQKSIEKIESIFFALLSICIFSFVIGIIKYITESSFQWMVGAYRSMVILAYVICGVLVLFFLFHAVRERNKFKKKSYLSFGFLYVAGYLFPLTDFIFPEQMDVYMVLCFIIFMNFIPLVWLKFYFLKYFVVGLTSSHEVDILELLREKYGISNRELEIIQQLLVGKSNKEIEDTLFISFNTVKNHIYNIYQKLGVKSRGQLLYFINNHQIN